MAAFATEPSLASRTAPFSCAALAPPCENATFARPPQRTTPRAAAKPRLRFMIHPSETLLTSTILHQEFRFQPNQITAAAREIGRSTPAPEHVYLLPLPL